MGRRTFYLRGKPVGKLDWPEERPKRRTWRRSCGRKRTYPSREEAQRAADDLAVKRPLRLLDEGPYKCRYGEHYHVGRRKVRKVKEVLHG